MTEGIPIPKMWDAAYTMPPTPTDPLNGAILLTTNLTTFNLNWITLPLGQIPIGMLSIPRSTSPLLHPACTLARVDPVVLLWRRALKSPPWSNVGPPPYPADRLRGISPHLRSATTGSLPGSHLLRGRPRLLHSGATQLSVAVRSLLCLGVCYYYLWRKERESEGAAGLPRGNHLPEW